MDEWLILSREQLFMKLEFDLKVQLVHKQKASGLMLSGWGMKEGKREVFGEGEVEKKKHCSYEKLGHTTGYCCLLLLLDLTPPFPQGLKLKYLPIPQRISGFQCSQEVTIPP